jgi:hypothetical protein
MQYLTTGRTIRRSEIVVRSWMFGGCRFNCLQISSFTTSIVTPTTAHGSDRTYHGERSVTSIQALTQIKCPLVFWALLTAVAFGLGVLEGEKINNLRNVTVSPRLRASVRKTAFGLTVKLSANGESGTSDLEVGAGLVLGRKLDTVTLE